jgi:hypothetical protein
MQWQALLRAGFELQTQNQLATPNRKINKTNKYIGFKK